jgi:hypothetical protein
MDDDAAFRKDLAVKTRKAKNYWSKKKRQISGEVLRKKNERFVKVCDNPPTWNAVRE